MLTKEERVLRLINRESVDFLPSQINFADRSRFKAISKALGLSSESELDEFLENHFQITFTLQDKPMIYRDVKEEIENLNELGYAFPDWENNVVYDTWGIGYKVGVGSFFVSFHPLQGKTTEYIAKFMPPNLSRKVIFESDIEIAVKEYNVPDVNMTENFSEWERDLKKHSGEFLVWPSGYAGIYERGYHILGFEEFMVNIALNPKVIEDILDKITDYKIEVAKKLVKIGFKIAHSGDDFGTQKGGFFPDSMFENIILPRLKRHWEIFTSAGIPIMFHSCGDIMQYIPDLIDIGLKILEPCQPCMDLKYLKKEFGKDIIFYGGINTQILPYLSEAETRDMVRETIRTLGKGGGYIIAPSQEIMNDVPIENIKAVVETIREEREKVLFM
ncbi:MAG: hypothetical protein M1371_07240 [Actinobacteria bacterium]|nr:hypothetical protein [Actinomycetota bacterium]